METQRLDSQPEDAPEHPTQRLPESTRRCLACQGTMAPLAYWTSAPDYGWGALRFGPRHPSVVPMPIMSLPEPDPYWERGRGAVFPQEQATGPMDVAPEVAVQAFACIQCGRLDWYVVGPKRGDEGGIR